MLRTKVLSLVARSGPSRLMSTATKLTTVEVNDKTGIATLTMCRAPVNGLNLELLKDLKTSIDEIESNKSRGLILTSSNATIFSAGLDIMEMYNPEKERIRAFWTQLQEVWLSLYGSSVPTAAAINGHSPAGGCLLATSCEYRVMLPKFTIGLNETQLGIVAPKWFMSSFLSVLPQRQAERALNQGRMFSTEEALQIGLIDETATSKEEAVEKCAAFLGTFARVNPLARALTKQQFRAADLQQLENERKDDLEKFLFFINQPAVQKGLGIYLEGLKKKAKK
ncbi:GL18943 [Drosophila persimilis]|uniref:Enoyl-CoA delta isomerase 1, mitochondrial n=2 Tax=pseudoobscura subgroup TaxID=32358 RepID=A0A6I8UJ50_DROPS|nr:enoyl-CoA delta isomerase 1, mitochondrial [Drosophila pseudoobscura]XP_002014457.1 enoyl-CoA delta isomerase 1, mitochondrial [Drosophila persimilis]XP_015035721.2 enoyl-CoA delta isomerase 1, mitochondrial [Drosophila pseudoobscura]EDW28453.1 GL18943 [Drosophila persimilis]